MVALQANSAHHRCVKEKIIDAEYELVSGPLRPGDEHPVRKGWYYTGRWNTGGQALWYRPPMPFWKRFLLLAAAAAVLMAAASLADEVLAFFYSRG
jgi:hypothetical protein